MIVNINKGDVGVISRDPPFFILKGVNTVNFLHCLSSISPQVTFKIYSIKHRFSGKRKLNSRCIPGLIKKLQPLTQHVQRGRGCRGAMILAKMTSEPQDLQNYLQAPQNWSPSLGSWRLCTPSLVQLSSAKPHASYRMCIL